MLFNFSNTIVESSFNIGLAIEPKNQIIAKKYLSELFNSFCISLNLNPTLLEEIPFEKNFTDVEFNKLISVDKTESFINQHFYPKLFNNIRKLEGNQFAFYVKYCFTLDKTLTPLETKNGNKYGSLKLGSKPVLYYIFVDVQEVINTIKEKR